MRRRVILAGLVCAGQATLAACGAKTNSNEPAASSSSVSAASAASTHSAAAQFPPKTGADLRGLAAKGDATAVHEFHREGTGLPSCSIPKREATVDAGITGQQLAEDLLAYYYAQQLNNPCGALVLAYHNQSEAGNAYTAGSINLVVNDSSGSLNIDPNASNLRRTLVLDLGPATGPQEFAVGY